MLVSVLRQVGLGFAFLIPSYLGLCVRYLIPTWHCFFEMRVFFFVWAGVVDFGGGLCRLRL